MQKVTFDQAAELIKTEAKMSDLLKYLAQNNLIKGVLNPNIMKDGKVEYKVPEDTKKRIPIVCPFHDTTEDDSTSIYTDIQKGDKLLGQTIKCYVGGCPASRPLNVIKTYMVLKLGVNPKVLDIKGATNAAYSQAIKELAEWLGYKIEHKFKPLTKEEKAALTHKDILKKSAMYYHKEFLENKTAQEYFLETRGFKHAVVDVKELIDRYKIGFAPMAFPSNWLYQLLAVDYTTEEILRTSVVKWVQFKDEDDKVVEEKPLDWHSEALVIPYWSRNWVTNLYSRGLNAPKNRRHLRLAGSVDEIINFEEATRFEELILIEGEISWLTLIALGYENAAANMGTNGLRMEHVEQLVQVREQSEGQLVKTVYLCYDGDGPGVKAALKTGKMLIDAGFDVRVILLPQGKDPNDILVEKKDAAKAYFDKLYAEAVSYYTFVALKAMDKEKTSAPERLAQFAEVKKIISEFSILDQAELYLIAKEFSEIAKIPLENVWSIWKPRESKNVEALYNQPFVFMTSDLESFYLTKTVFEEKIVLNEDSYFIFVNQEIKAKTFIVDNVAYSENDLENIKKFATEHGIRLLFMNNFKNIYKMSRDEILNDMLSI